MLSWGEFGAARPGLAEAGRELFYQFGVGLGFLATVRPDGGPRVHPMCPLIFEDGLYAFVVPGPKMRDLRRDGRYAMHSFPSPHNEDAVYLTGTARELADPGLRARAATTYWEERSNIERPPSFDEQMLFEFLIGTCLLTRTTGHGDHDPKHTIWKAS